MPQYASSNGTEMDIIEWLRWHTNTWRAADQASHADILDKAADEIERLKRWSGDL